MVKAEIKIHNTTAGWFSQDENGYHFLYDPNYPIISIYHRILTVFKTTIHRIIINTMQFGNFTIQFGNHTPHHLHP